MTNKVPVTYTSTHGRPTDLVPIDCEQLKFDPLLQRLLGLCSTGGNEHYISNIIKSEPNIGVGNNELIWDKVKGNVLVRVGGKDVESMFSCHMDIVGNNYNKQGIDHIALLTPNPKFTNNLNRYGFIWGAKSWLKKDSNEVKYSGSTLGADDKVGVWICLKMIEQNIPGLYVFHTGEESGGHGSRHLVANHKDIFKNIKRAVAFDRAGYNDVITYQRGGRCASDKFGEALAEQLNINMPPKEQFKSGARGTFTDTANYIDIIPECTNLSVGYFNQHGENEHLDWLWLSFMMLPAVLKIDWDKLPTERDPTKKEISYSSYSSYTSTYGGNSDTRVSWDEVKDDTPWLKLPRWEPSMGHVPNKPEKVVKQCMDRYITSCFGKDKQEFVEHLYNVYSLQELMLEDLQAKDAEIQMFKHKLGLKKKKQDKPADEQIVTKKQFLQELITLSDKIEVYGNYKEWLDGYLLGANAWLVKNKDRHYVEQYTKKELEKLNRLIYAIAGLMDMTTSLPECQKTLDAIENYISDHPEEEGFELASHLQELQEASAIAISTKDVKHPVH